MDISSALSYLGLNEKQAGVYAGLLQLGEATAYGIAQKSGLKRPTVYVILDELRLKGLVHKTPHARKQLFTARPPDEIIREKQGELDSVKELLPRLMAMAAREQKTRTLFFEGTDGVAQLLNYGLTDFAGSKDPVFVGFYGQAGRTDSKTLEAFDDYNDRLKRLGIRVKGIVPDHPNLKKFRLTDHEYGRELRVIPPERYSATISVDVGGTFVRLLAYEDLWGVVLEGAQVASAFREIFNMVWATLEPQST